jgi:hypothetical protein
LPVQELEKPEQSLTASLTELQPDISQQTECWPLPIQTVQPESFDPDFDPLVLEQYRLEHFTQPLLRNLSISGHNLLEFQRRRSWIPKQS